MTAHRITYSAFASSLATWFIVQPRLIGALSTDWGSFAVVTVFSVVDRSMGWLVLVQWMDDQEKHAGVVHLREKRCFGTFFVTAAILFGKCMSRPPLQEITLESSRRYSLPVRQIKQWNRLNTTNFNSPKHKTIAIFLQAWFGFFNHNKSGT